MIDFKKKMIDILPGDETAVLATEENIDLKEKSEIPSEPEPSPEPSIETKETSDSDGLDKLMSEIIDVDPKEIAHESLVAMLGEVEPLVELASIGAKIGGSEDKFEKTNQDPVNFDEDFYKNILGHINTKISPDFKSVIPSVSLVSAPPKAPSAPEVLSLNYAIPESFIKEEALIQKAEIKPEISPEKAKNIVSFYNKAPEIKIERANFNFAPSQTGKRRSGLWIAILLMLGVVVYGFVLKDDLARGGVVAFENLEQAGESLKQMNFEDAQENFSKSYEDFSRISQTMNITGLGFISSFSDIPGLSKIKSARDLTEAGKLIAQSGQAMSEALDYLSHTGSILNPTDKNKTKPLKILNQIKDALILSNNNFRKAKALITNVDSETIPEDGRGKFNDFKDKLPLFEEYLGNSIEYVEFLEGIVGIDEPKKYLLLFNNNSELRPTGGFPGTYGVVSFASGGLGDFFVNDVYNLDGQLKRNIIPPKQLQHITPTWGMRDSSWFIDFPASSKKAMSFFAQEAGYKVNGVIALNPDIVTGILGVVGPIDMPEYDITLNAGNFLETIQEEVEYGPNRSQPKKIVVDFGPRFLEKLYSADSEKWSKIFNILMVGLQERDVMFYLEDKELQNFVIKEGFGGEVKKTEGDYLTVNFSNIKGSKTDVVTDSSIEVSNRFEEGKVIHKVTITRDHRGGDHEHGFYNRQNSAYVRVLIPSNADFLGISGNDKPNFNPLLNYSIQKDFEKDRDLSVFESSFYSSNFAGADKFEESGKKGIGFWMLTDPKTSKKIEFEYAMPLSNQDYSFYFQKQPGLDWKNFTFKIDNSGNYEPANSSIELSKLGGVQIYEELLKKDFVIDMSLKKK